VDLLLSNTAGMTRFVEKQAVLGPDRTVFCPVRFAQVPLTSCLDCARLARVDEADPPRFILCDARVLDRRAVADLIDDDR
jgi:hypothetical protein